VQVQAVELTIINGYLPAEIRAQHKSPAELVSSTLLRTAIIGFMFIAAHYL
jgi:hypothetical protein